MQDDQSRENSVPNGQPVDDNARRQLVERLVIQFAEAGFHWALAVLGDEAAAYDALQDAWLNAYLHLDQLRESTAFSGWFRQIVLSACYHALRHDQPAIPLPDENGSEVAAPQADPTDEIENKERREHIREAVLALPEHERIVTELFYFADLPQQQIAEVLAVPVTTVKKRLQYARQRLKGLIQPEFVNQLDLYGFNGGDTAAFNNFAQGSIDWLPVGTLFGVPVDWMYERETECNPRRQ